jgi:hypothetical protein
MINRFTIHHKPTHHPYTVNVEDQHTQEFRTYVFTFRRKVDAMKMARMIEVHYTERESWPNNQVSTEQSFELYGSTKDIKARRRLEHLYVRGWNEETLHAYVAQLLIHIIFFEKLSHHGTIMQYHAFDYPLNYLRIRLENMDTM